MNTRWVKNITIKNTLIVSRSIPVIYIKRFPKISYVNLDTAIGDLSYLIWGLFAFGGLVIIPFVLALALFF